MHSDNRRHIDESTTVYGRLWVHLYSHIYKPIISFLGYHVKSLNKTKNLILDGVSPGVCIVQVTNLD